jgi:hypothetical protein
MENQLNKYLTPPLADLTRFTFGTFFIGAFIVFVVIPLFLEALSLVYNPSGITQRILLAAITNQYVNYAAFLAAGNIIVWFSLYRGLPTT